jgi:hypothetical protein
MAAPSSPEEALQRGEDARRERRLGDADRAFSEAVSLLRRAGDETRLAHALTRSAQIARDRKDFDRAALAQAEALAIVRRTGDPALPHVARHMADILHDAARHAEAAPLFAEMLTLYRAAPSTPPLEMANAVRSAACHAEAIGDAPRAAALWREARDRYAALDDLFHQLTGTSENPGVREADLRLAALDA